ncbi:hypothetical protein AB0F81_44370 [Actinoplanes sp. NPDC024001]|uniref:hypothetical protein n=1 Tax=Actinoplanes sp. NPDC024001 TaxID=3154598 RepID=UPI0033CC1AAA
MRIGISGTHGTGKTALAEALCARLPGHVVEAGPHLRLPPSAEDCRALVARSVRCLTSPASGSGVVFDRTPLDYLAYQVAIGADLAENASLRPAFAGLDLLVVTPITAETERLLPAAELPDLRSRMNDALLDLVHTDPLHAWRDTPVLQLSGPLGTRLDTVLGAITKRPVTRPRASDPGGVW